MLGKEGSCYMPSRLFHLLLVWMLMTRSTESHSPPPNNPEFDQRYWPRPQPQKHQHQNGESLIKQTYSTTMIEDGKEKKWHVVAYANKVSILHLAVWMRTHDSTTQCSMSWAPFLVLSNFLYLPISPLNQDVSLIGSSNARPPRHMRGDPLRE